MRTTTRGDARRAAIRSGHGMTRPRPWMTPVARAIGDVARQRWKMATGQTLQTVDVDADAWPACLEPTMRDVPVGIARTLPELKECREVREIEALYLAGIAAARYTIYLESQYLAARRLAETLAARLAEPYGPEVVIVLPEEIGSWLEHEVMDGARARLLHMLWRADKHARLGAFIWLPRVASPSTCTPRSW